MIELGRRAFSASWIRGSACLGMALLVVTTDPACAQSRMDDGPHVYWRGEGHATVFHLCHGELLRERHQGRDTLVFQGLCADSARTYRMSVGSYDPMPPVSAGSRRILAVSDVHGEYEDLLELLIGAGIIDEGLDWIWGDGQLVVVGDVFDRGDRVTESLWLIHRLERQAAAAGGRVHYLLGNHEVMVLRGDLRYVNDKYMGGIVRRSDVDYQDLFGPDMELGRWLRSKNAAMTINGILFVHGGVSPAMLASGLDLKGINAAVRRAIDARSYEVAFDSTLSLVLGSEGPLWYRGYHQAMDERYPRAGQGDVAAVMDRFGASALVVGHTEIPEVRGLYEGRVYAIDVPVDELGGLQGLLWVDGTFFRVDRTGERTGL